MGPKLFIIALLLLIISGLGVRVYQQSLLPSQLENRFNLVLIYPESDINLLSWDPVERSLTNWTFPAEVSIRGRTGGEYEVGALYQLGNYEGRGGVFARQKIQGFMRVPIAGYLVVAEGGGENVRGSLWRGLVWSWGKEKTNLSIVDRAILWLRMNYTFRQIEKEELMRAGVMSEVGEEQTFRYERMQEYVGKKLFDWQTGWENIAVAVVNASGKDGLGSDVADFLSNWGLDVVMVRTANNEEVVKNSLWQVGSVKQAKELEQIFRQLLQLGEAKIEEVPIEYRAMVLLTVGTDAEDLF